MNELKPLSTKVRKKGLATLPDATGRRQRKSLANWDYVSREGERFDLTSDHEDKLANALKDRSLARRIVKLQEKHPYGTVPEMMAVDYLQRKQERYTYQAQLYGGWRAGGMVPDFVVHRPGGLLAMLINGNYWHPHPQKNEADKMRIRGAPTDGGRISNVVIVWESALMRMKDEVLDAAMAGIELGQ